MNDRKPIYGKIQGTRIISVPGGLWQAQRHVGGKGTRECDPWENIARPADKDDALSQVGGRS